MKGIRFCCLVLTLSLFDPAIGLETAWAQAGPSAKNQEEADLREALRSIIKEDPANAAKARKALDALDQPESSPARRQARNRRESGAKRIVNGLPSRSHPAVGALLKGNEPQSAGAWCTGTLVGCDKFLTAAHCIARDPTPGSYLVFFQELGFFEVKAVQWEPEKYNFPIYDLAMLTLAKPVEGIAPMPINMTAKPLNNSIATIVGFGRTGGRRLDYGIKREGSVKLAACPARYAKSQVLCWNFDADVTSNASAQNTCNADSGGGIFMRDNDKNGRVVEKLFGTVSGGEDAEGCMKNDVSFNVDVHQYSDWINRAGEGRLSSGMCGSPLWENDADAPSPRTLTLDETNPEATFTVETPEDATALRIAMNAEDNGAHINHFEFAAFASKDAGGAENACKDNGTGQFAFCAIEKPQSGPWTIALKRTKGAGVVQITTLFVSK